MSLLDDASIVVTPNGYKAGVLFSVIPSSGAADLEVIRATAATRVDENGLVNYAEIIGGEEVTCGDFECADPAAFWSEGSGWSFSEGKAIYDGTGGTSAIAQSNVIEVGKQYKLIIEVLSNEGSGSNTIYLGGTIINPSHLSVGTHTFFGSTSNTNVNLNIYGRSGEVFEIGSVSVKEVTRDNVPRIDYTGGGCPHILAEPMRTNLITYSEDFSDSSWTKSGITLTAGQISPSGDASAYKLAFSANNDYVQAAISGLDISKEYTLSFYAKVDSGTTTIESGNVNGGAYETLTITDEWKRFEVTQTPSGTTRYPRPIRANGSDEIYLWGAQLEVGSYPTSLIPASGGTVTRNQDIFTRDGIGSLINSTEGVLFLEMAALSDDGTSRCISIFQNGSNFIKFIYSASSNRVDFVAFSDGNVSCNITKVISNTTENTKFALKWKVNDFALWIDGTEVGTDLSGDAPLGMDKMYFTDEGGSGNKFFGKVKQLQVYNTALTDEQLLQLTGESGTDFYESYAEMASALTYTIQ